MPRIMIKCPKTGEPVFTGIEMDDKSFRNATLKNETLKCPDCDQVHIWNKKDAFLRE